MITTVNKWGNSLAIRIPSSFAKELMLGEDTKIELTVNQGVMHITPTDTRRKEIEDRFKAFSKTKERIKGEIDWGTPAGEEVW